MPCWEWAIKLHLLSLFIILSSAANPFTILSCPPLFQPNATPPPPWTHLLSSSSQVISLSSLSSSLRGSPKVSIFMSSAEKV